MADWPTRGETPWDEKLKTYIDEAVASGAPNVFPRTRSGKWLMGFVSAFVTNHPPGRGYVPIQVFREQSWSALGVNIDTAVEGATVHVALYADDGTGYPGERIIDAGLIDASTTGVSRVDLSEPLVLPPGLYWTWAYVSNSSVRLPVTSHSQPSRPGTLWHEGPAGANATLYQGGYTSAGTTPPAVAPGGMGTNRHMPIISMRAE